MSKVGRRQLVARLCLTSVEADMPAGTPDREFQIGALQQVFVNGENMHWVQPPIGPKTVRLFGHPQEIPASTLTGQEAFTTAPESEEEVHIPAEGLQLTDEQAQELGGVEGEPEEDEDADDDGEAGLEDTLAYLDLEDSIDAKRQAGEPISAQEYQAAREMRAHLRLIFQGDGSESEAAEEDGWTEAPDVGGPQG